MPKQAPGGFTYWQLRAEVGIEGPDLEARDKEGDYLPNPLEGEPGVGAEHAIDLGFPVMVAGIVVEEVRTVVIRPREQKPPPDWHESKTDGNVLTCARYLPGTRVIETNAPPVIQLLAGDSRFEQVDPPKSVQPHHPRRQEASK